MPNMKLISMLLMALLLAPTAIATNALYSYYQSDGGQDQVPQYRTWDGTTISTEAHALSVGGKDRKFQRFIASPSGDTGILGTLDDKYDINFQVYNGSAWGNLIEVATNAPTTRMRVFDIAYEQQTGRAIVLYAKDSTNKLYYRIWNGTSWSNEAEATHAGNSWDSFSWVRLESNPDSSSNEIIAVFGQPSSFNDYIRAMVWNGTAWGNKITLSSSSNVYQTQCFDVAYEQQSNDAMVVFHDWDRSPAIQYRIWNGNSWSTRAALNSIGSDNIRNIRLAADPNSDSIIMAALDSGRDLNTQVWDGSSWGTDHELDNNLESSNNKIFDMAYETNTSDAVIMYGERNKDKMTYRTWDGSSWSSPSDAPSGTTDARYIQLEADPNSSSQEIQALVVDDGKDINVLHWNGNSWNSIQEIETKSESSYEPATFDYFNRVIPQAQLPVVYTDKPSYSAEENVTITGLHFTPNSTVSLALTDQAGNSAPSYPKTKSTSITGAFDDLWFTNNYCAGTYNVTATDQTNTSMTDSTTFTIENFTDEFNSSSLNSKWSWFNEAPAWDIGTTLSDHLTMESDTHTDFWNGMHNGNFLYQTLNGDFQLDVKQIAQPQHDAEQSGIFIRQDENNWIKLAYTYEEGSPQNRYVESSPMINGYADEYNQTYLNFNNHPFWFRINRTGNTWRTYYSTDGVNWVHHATWSNQTLSNTLQVGIYVADGNGTHNYPASFDYARLTKAEPCETFEPQIHFVTPTPSNNTMLNATWSYINATSNFDANAAFLEWQGTNESISTSGLRNFYKNKTGLSNGVYTYKVWANDSLGNWHSTETRTVIINYTSGGYYPGELFITNQNLSNCPTRICAKVTMSPQYNYTTYSLSFIDPAGQTQQQNTSVNEVPHTEIYQLTQADLSGQWWVNVSDNLCRIDAGVNVSVNDNPNFVPPEYQEGSTDYWSFESQQDTDTQIQSAYDTGDTIYYTVTTDNIDNNNITQHTVGIILTNGTQTTADNLTYTGPGSQLPGYSTSAGGLSLTSLIRTLSRYILFGFDSVKANALSQYDGQLTIPQSFNNNIASAWAKLDSTTRVCGTQTNDYGNIEYNNSCYCTGYSTTQLNFSTDSCSACAGQMKNLTLMYLGNTTENIKIIEHDGQTVFQGQITPGQVFSFDGLDQPQDFLGPKIKIFVQQNETDDNNWCGCNAWQHSHDYYCDEDYEFDVSIHTSCSRPIYVGLVKGDFMIVGGDSRHGGPLPNETGGCAFTYTKNTSSCAGDNNHDGIIDACTCENQQDTFFSADKIKIGNPIIDDMNLYLDASYSIPITNDIVHAGETIYLKVITDNLNDNIPTTNLTTNQVNVLDYPLQIYHKGNAFTKTSTNTYTAAITLPQALTSNYWYMLQAEFHNAAGKEYIIYKSIKVI